jgi:hypothetical protein
VPKSKRFEAGVLGIEVLKLLNEVDMSPNPVQSEEVLRVVSKSAGVERARSKERQYVR